jgi:phosphatidylinositol-bisphosphatase
LTFSDKNFIDFGDMTYGITKTLSVSIENSGKVLAKFQFIPKLNETKYCKPWLHVSPAFGLLVPGEKVEIKFTVTIGTLYILIYSNALPDNTTVMKFNDGKETLEDILILHLSGGLDFFVYRKFQENSNI